MSAFVSGPVLSRKSRQWKETATETNTALRSLFSVAADKSRCSWCSQPKSTIQNNAMGVVTKDLFKYWRNSAVISQFSMC